MITSYMRTAPAAANFVFSQDGTKISYLTMGSGPAVIVIPGVLSTASDYVAFARALAGHFTVHIIERRGRGESGPQGADYSIRKECEDVFALQQKTGASFLVGHSFGGFVALEAARHNPSFTKIAVYEPGVSIDGSIPMDWIPGNQKKLAEKRELDAFVEFSLSAGPERVRQTPHWLMKLMLPLFLSPRELKQRLSLLHESIREHQETARLDSSYENYREIAAGVLLMYGGKSDSSWVQLALERLSAVIPQSETQRFPRLNHFGIDKKAPREVAEVVCAYFLK
ncbi:alpha/beta hydrolase [Dictyobacter sp. S3.2.2.5]|uniref:Alpha/beta hydrolase n=1 Tax=Dictyobacter halimunensis TaxID=3026934 RepID=A0ABQ6G4J1_9CHLR|nr:alpha/beta hydrolase [Dictyobacter sp. S3.2.2.5]